VSATPTITATATGTATQTATQTTTASLTATVTTTSTATRTVTNTRTVTATRTITGTVTVTPTFTPRPPVIDPVESGDDTVTGTGQPNCSNPPGVKICLIGGGGTTPSMPPCSAPDTLLGTGSTNGAGDFSIMLPAPITNNQCIYAFDMCNSLVGPPVCATAPAPAPALSPRMTLLAVLMLSAIALIGLVRRRRSG
jgi:MYXO-CTERM domain-containing protein